MATQGKAAPNKGAAARAEVNGNGNAQKKIKWNGLDLKLPKELPGTVLWDFAALEDGQKQLAPLIALIRSVVGDEQNQQIIEKVREKGWSIEKTTEALMDEDRGLVPLITAQFGLSTGESEASQAA